MKRITIILSCGLCLLIQTSTALPKNETEAALYALPSTASPVDHGGKIEMKYDGFNHETIVTLNRMLITCGGAKGMESTIKETCVSLVASLKAAGYDVAITVYPGAYHGFDNPWGGGYVRLPFVDNGATCVFRVPSILGPIPSRAEVKACLTKGATVGGDRKALEQAQSNVRAELAELLK